ncbi:butyrate kinase [Pseudodesulfovibrio sp. JC047]|uniref:butyrate kinase n=1 Tax=Pseudodesulfovibrio sp. JC047 TaxID=2683199 RepID=UPI0013D7F5E4|nr:butyrate kinase [Pseudodesulfovibrio sp. JC047]
MKILAINPGGTSTKIAVFENQEELFSENVIHKESELHDFDTVFDQFRYRKDLIVKVLRENDHMIEDFDCVVGRGGLLKPVEGGTYEVNAAMIEDLRNAINGEHPSNLGPVIAKDIADSIAVPAFIVDPVSVDEFLDIAKISGISDISRSSWMHALNQKAVCRETAERLNGGYRDFNFIVAHLGSGISIAAHRKGRMIDGSGGRCDGPFSPERCGGLPSFPLVELCYSGKYTRKEMVNKISTKAGMFDYLGTKDMMEIENRYLEKDDKVVKILDSFIYQTAKEIAAYGASLSGDVDRIIITGGIAHSALIVSKLKEQVGYLAEFEVIAGEKEMTALALGALRVMGGAEEILTY